jgi:hypothetical protein
MNLTDFSAQTSARLFDRLISEKNVRRFEVNIIRLAILSFFLHLAIIATLNHTDPTYLENPLNYLRAIYTPFSFILVYEVFLLVIILPLSISEFIGKQFEIITLITLRSFFHDIGNLPNQSLLSPSDPSIPLLGYDLIATLSMCALTLIFHRLHSRTRDTSNQDNLIQFVNLKKTIALGLLVILLVASMFSFSSGILTFAQAFLNKTEFPDPNQFFYLDFFTIMVFADVFLLLVSLHFDSSFYPVVRNASFVISTILLKFSLSVQRPFNHLIAIAALVFSVSIILILRVRKPESPAAIVSNRDGTP